MTYLGWYHEKANVLAIPKMLQFLSFEGFQPEKEERKKERYICRKAHIIHGTFSLLIPLEPSHATMSAPKCWVHSQTPHIVIFRVQFSVRSRLDYSLSSSLYANIIIFETQISYPTGEDNIVGTQYQSTNKQLRESNKQLQALKSVPNDAILK